MKRFFERAGSWAVFAAMRALAWLPDAAIDAVGRVAGAVVFRLVGERRRVARINLGKCFPGLSPGEREKLARAHFRAFCAAFADRSILWWGTRRRIERLVSVEGLEHLRALSGTPVILFAPHFVGLDAGLTRLGAERDMVIMYGRQKDPAYDRLLARGRTRFGDQQLVSRQEGIRAAIASMRSGRPFYYLPDQDFGPRDAVFVPFFGVAAATVPGLSRIARVAGARVLPCVTRRLEGGRGYVLRIDPAWEDFPTADPVADTRRMNEWLERRILEMPEQYFWLHKRFKTRPAGEALFY